MACPANQSRRSLLYARFKLKSPFKGAVWSTSCKTNIIFFDLVHQWRKFPPKWLGFGNLIMTIHKNSYKRQEGGKLNYNFKKGREDVFKTIKNRFKTITDRSLLWPRRMPFSCFLQSCPILSTWHEWKNTFHNLYERTSCLNSTVGVVEWKMHLISLLGKATKLSSRTSGQDVSTRQTELSSGKCISLVTFIVL